MKTIHDFNLNKIIFDADSYKFSHHKLIPPATEYMSSYIEARWGDYDDVVFFGMQMFIQKVLLQPISLDDIDFAEKMIVAHGLPFNREGWEHIVKEHSGYLPILIRALPEGSVVKKGRGLVEVVNLDPALPWLTSFVETALLRAIWYPTTIASRSFYLKKVLFRYYELTSDEPLAALDFKLHDFGSRGVSSRESAEIGGLAHLLSFKGTDTVPALWAAMKYYGADGPVGFSIPASEHSTIMAWGGPIGEFKAFDNMLDQYAKPGSLLACVSDTYDIDAAVNRLWGECLKKKIIESGATLIVRPDSGDPLTMPIRVIESLEKNFGSKVNTMGYKVLNNVRVIQGDGITERTIPLICQNLMNAGYALDNLAFGMGAGLLQKVDRDTLGFAMKANAIKYRYDRSVYGQYAASQPEEREMSWVPIQKKPVSDPKKASKAGRIVDPELFDCFLGHDFPHYRQETWETIRARVK